MNTIIIRCVNDEQRENIACAYESFVHSDKVCLNEKCYNNSAFIILRKVGFESSQLEIDVQMSNLTLVALSLMKAGVKEWIFFRSGKLISFYEPLLTYCDGFIGLEGDTDRIRGDVLFRSDGLYTVVL